MVLVSVRKTTPHHHTGDDYNSDSSRQPRKLILGMQHYLTPSKQNMKDDLNFLNNGRQPQFLSHGRHSFQLVFFKTNQNFNAVLFDWNKKI